ncbi:hypothetical protein G7Y79_00034g069700 [Physcia stellaris]|nr:hypothetical protein G7Y79_00034g069700 [Physcia stellaris]
MRHFLRFIDLDDTFVAHGFRKKMGAAFKLNNEKAVGLQPVTDFVAVGGPGNHSWNVVRSEADDLMFRHAGKCGAEIFDGTKVDSIEFVPTSNANGQTQDASTPDPGRPVSATWSRKDGSSGKIEFDYLVDASGRAGVVSTKYLKNRKHNQGLKNIANWGYWQNAGDYAVGTPREGQPFFEALSDASGWCWFIPLHNGTTSVGVVQNQELAMTKKKAMESPSTVGFYKESLNLAPGVKEILANGELVSDVKAASDWSYSASTYATTNVRLVGDAGCFIDPYFSSGVHLALSGALSAATTICAAMRGDCDEQAAGKWHSSKVSEAYTRFLMVVLSALKQIRKQDQPILSDMDEEGFEKAFAHFRPIIQGTADTNVNGKLSQEELSNTVDFCLNAFEHHAPEKHQAVLKKMETAVFNDGAQNAPSLAVTSEKEAKVQEKNIVDPEGLSPDEVKILNTIRARQMLRVQDTMSIKSFTTDTINGLSPLVQRGSLGLRKAGAVPMPTAPMTDLNARVPTAIKV